MTLFSSEPTLLPTGATAEIPTEVTAEGRRWRVERAWPDGAGGATVEVRAGDLPGVRAGVFAAASGITLHPAGVDPRLPALAALAREGTVVSHRVGRRAVVKGADRFSKVVRPVRAAGMRTAHERAGAAGFDRAFELARAWCAPADEQGGVVHFSVLEGRTLHDLGSDRETGEAAFARAWQSWGDGWSAMLSHAQSGAPADALSLAELPAHGVADEVAVIRTWAAHGQRMLPARAPDIHRAEQRVLVALAATPPDPLVLSHRDLHDKQVLHAPGRRPAVLDLDTASRAEAALDLGNLRAHLAFRAAQGALSGERADIARRIVDEVVDRMGVSPERLVAYEKATALRLGCLYLFRPRWRETAERWLAAQGV